MKEHPPIIWDPPESMIEDSNLSRYMKWLKSQKGLEFSDYESVWEWSTKNIEDFWESLVEYFDIDFHKPYDTVLTGERMPHYKWFDGAELNYTKQIFKNKSTDYPALISLHEDSELKETSWEELEGKVAAVAAYLRSCGVKKGDTVAAFAANVPEVTICFLATVSIGAIWSSCSPDFGQASVLERFSQIKPKVFIAVNGYSYNGKVYDKRDIVQEVRESLPELEATIGIEYISGNSFDESLGYVNFNEVLETEHKGIEYAYVDFSHPIWVLYSSGTTGNPKAITHSHGGMLLEHLKYLTFHNDVRKGERFFWYSTTGWMMWNFVQASMLTGATAVLYDGSAGYPDLMAMWKMVEDVGIHHFGTSAPFIIACMQQGIQPNETCDLSSLRSIGSTGSPLPPEAFSYIKENVKENVWLCSMSGGTDMCTAFVGGCPIRPVYKGEIQCRALGCDLHALDDYGNQLENEVGEMVIVKPMPCMPIYLWGDSDFTRYEESYFTMYEGMWRHGDWVKITDRGTLIIYGRSDATLNRHGVRIGTAEIYRVLNDIPEIADSLIVNIEQDNGEHFMPLFVKLKEGSAFNDNLKDKIKKALRDAYSPRHVPDVIVKAPDIPRTISGKKMETPVKKILMKMPLDKAINKDAMKNPESVDFFVSYSQTN